jgi:hypothetical protein
MVVHTAEELERLRQKPRHSLYVSYSSHIAILNAIFSVLLVQLCLYLSVRAPIHVVTREVNQWLRKVQRTNNHNPRIFYFGGSRIACRWFIALLKLRCSSQEE